MRNKIIFFHLYNNYSGSPRVLADILSIVKKKYKVQLVTSRTTGFLTDIDVDKKLISYNWSEKKFVTLINFIFAQFSFVYFAFILGDKNSVFYINTQQPTIVGLIGKLKGNPVVFHVHEKSSSQKYFGRIYRRIREFVKGEEVFVSNYIKEVEKITDYNSQVIYNTISNNLFSESRDFIYAPFIKGEFVVSMICSLRDYKGIPELLGVGSLLTGNKHIKFQLVVDGSEEATKKYFKMLKVPENVFIYPRTSSPEDYFKNSSLVLNLSRVDEWIETFGLTILEAMNFGIPCIVPPIGGPIEIIDDGVNGFCISSYNLEDIALKIEELSINPDLCLQLSRAAKIKSCFFSKEKFEKDMLEFIDTLK